VGSQFHVVSSRHVPANVFLTPTHMRSVNKVILVGHLAADPERSQTKVGKTRVTFPIATHRETTSEGAEREVTDYHRVVAWGKLGEVCDKYLAKGQGVYVEGMLLNRAYEERGQRRFATEIRADEVNLLTWKKKAGVTKVALEMPDGESVAA
jgi:single-strand DNA-binding protein